MFKPESAKSRNARFARVVRGTPLDFLNQSILLTLLEIEAGIYGPRPYRLTVLRAELERVSK